MKYLSYFRSDNPILLTKNLFYHEETIFYVTGILSGIGNDVVW